MSYRSKLGLAALLAAGLSAVTPPAWSTTVQPMTVVQLLSEAKVIVWGKVTDVQIVAGTGLPHTQVTLEVLESFRGGPKPTFSFNQFGNAVYSAEPDGLVRLTGTPGGFPTYRVGEEILLFMGGVAAATGLRSPLGLGAGTFKISADQARNEVENVGLFTGVRVHQSIQTEPILDMMATTEGAYEAADFVDFVRKATSENWTGRGLLTLGGATTGGSTGGRNGRVDE